MSIQAASNPTLNQGLELPLTTSDTAVGPSSTDPVYLSPEALMAYIQTKLQHTDSQIQGVLNEQTNIQWEQQQIGDIMSDISSYQSTLNSSGVLDNGGGAVTQLEQKIEDLITQIQQRDPGCAVLPQLETLHDTIMATGTGPYPDPNNSNLVHGYYCSNTGGAVPPNGPTPPANVNSDQDSKIGGDELQHFTDTLTQINGTLNSNSTLNMVQVQSLMSDRTTAIQLATNILQSFDDGLNKVASNIGH